MTVGGNFTGSILIVSESGNDPFSVGRTWTNQGVTFLGNDRCFGATCPGFTPPTAPLPGPTTTVGTLVNNGTIWSWSNITASTLVNNGTTTLIGNSATTGTLRNGGVINFSNGCCSLALEATAGLGVGTGTSGSTGYRQSANGVLDEVLSGSSTYGRIIAPPWAGPPAGAMYGYPVDLNGTLDIMLQNGFVPTIGESFTIISTLDGDLSGTFSNVTWDSFDDGRGYFLVDYHGGSAS